MSTKVIVLIAIIFFSLSVFGFINSAQAAEKDYKYQYAKQDKRGGTTAYFKFPDWLSLRYIKLANRQAYVKAFRLQTEYYSIEYFKWELKSGYTGRTIGVIHDYDDYTHIMRTYETKE